jgi:adenylate kinase
MEDSSKRFTLNVEQSTRLLKLGLQSSHERVNQSVNRDRADLLLDVLASKLPTDPALIETLPTVLRSLSEELQSVSGKPLGVLLQSPETKTVQIRRIKDFAKQLGASAKDDVEREVALALYFAAIANVLVYHNVKISQYSHTELAQSFDTLGGHDWIPPNLTRLFRKAQQHCNQKSQ